jgi:hypothetical protein
VGGWVVQKVQGKVNALCGFAVVICAAYVCRGVVEVVALLGYVQEGHCFSCAYTFPPFRSILRQVLQPQLRYTTRPR